MVNHELYMARCLELAQGGLGLVAPNPLVGAVLVHNNKILSEGFHHIYGGDHAEVVAIKKINDKKHLQDATLYVNLEPCSHHGKTPPCADLIIESGIKNVVVANLDPNPLVEGKGIQKLKKAKVNVITGVLEKEGLELNKRFFAFHNFKRPYIILKWAQTANGLIAPLKNNKPMKGVTWISNESSRLLVHKWRSEEMAVLVGQNTVKNDDPALTTRHFNKKNAFRVVIDPKLELSTSKKVFNSESKSLIYNHKKNLDKDNLQYIKVSKGDEFLNHLLSDLYSKNIQSIIVEGGAFTLNKFFESGLWDEARIFTSQISFHEGIKAPNPQGKLVSTEFILNDKLDTFYNNIQI